MASNRDLYLANKKKKNEEQQQQTAESTGRLSNRDMYLQSHADEIQSRNVSTVGKLDSLLKKYEDATSTLYNGYNNRYAKKGTGYRADASSYADKVQKQSDSISKDADEIRKLLNQYESAIGKDKADSIRDYLHQNDLTRRDIRRSTSKDAEYSRNFRNADDYKAKQAKASYAQKYDGATNAEQESAYARLNNDIRRAGNRGDTKKEQQLGEELDYLVERGGIGMQLHNAQRKQDDVNAQMSDLDRQIAELTQANKDNLNSFQEITPEYIENKKRIDELQKKKSELEASSTYYAEVLSKRGAYRSEYDDKYNGMSRADEAAAVEDLQRRKQKAEAKISASAPTDDISEYKAALNQINEELDYLYSFGNEDSQYQGRRAWLAEKQAENAAYEGLPKAQEPIQNAINLYERSEQGIADKYYEYRNSGDFEYYASLGESENNYSADEINAAQGEGLRNWMSGGEGSQSDGTWIRNKIKYYDENKDLFDGSVKNNINLRNNAAAAVLNPLDGSYDIASWGEWKPEEKQMYNYILGKYGTEAADQYLADMQLTLDRRANETQAQELGEIAQTPGVKGVLARTGMSVESILDQTLGAVSTYANDLGEMAVGKYNPYSDDNRLYLKGQNLRSAVTGNLSERFDTEFLNANVAGQIYNSLMSSGDSMAGAAALGKAYTLVMASGAASAHAQELYEKGATPKQIFLGSLAAGAAEAITEYISLDRLLKEKNVDSIRRYVAEVLKQAGVEGSEEIGADILNYISDAVIMGVNSDYQQSIGEYEARGYSRSDAERAAFLDAVKETVWSGISGAISGGFSSMGFTGAQAIENYNTGKAINAYDNAEGLVSIGADETAGKEANKIATRAQAQLNTTGKVSNLTLGALQKSIRQGQFASYADAVKSVSDRDTITNTLVESGMSYNDAREYAGFISRTVEGKSLSKEAQAKLESNEVASQTLEEVKETISEAGVVYEYADAAVAATSEVDLKKGSSST